MEELKPDLSKIREIALQLQEDQIQDCYRSIENEVNKSLQALAFIGVFLGLIFGDLKQINPETYTVPIVFLFLAILFSLNNILAKSVGVHLSTNKIFVKTYSRTWEQYLDDKHVSLDGIYKTISKLLTEKVFTNRIVFITLMVSILSFAIIRVFYE